MTSVMVTTWPSWFPGGPLGFVRYQTFVEKLVRDLPAMVAPALESVDESADIDPAKILVDAAPFSKIVQNNPDIWVILTIARNEIYTNAKAPILEHLWRSVYVFQQERSSVKAKIALDVDFTDGTGVLLDGDGEIIDSW